MTDRYWSGTVWYYNDISNFDRDKAFVATKTESGVCDAVCIDHDKFVVTEDSGVLQILNFCQAPGSPLYELQCAGYACLHDSSILTVSTFSDEDHVVTGGLDCCLKVWDLVELIVTYSFGYAQTDVITCVHVQPQSTTTFASTSLDGEALMWDIRQSKPAHSILKKNAGLTAVNWKSTSDHVLALGTDEGAIMLVDTRNSGPSSVLEETCVFPRSIHRLLFNPNPERSDELAGCCDGTMVQVLDTNNKFSSIYKDDLRHKDFVRGLTWFNDELHTCSWDNTVFKHTIHPVKNE
ncbi:methylosome protein WDR77 isoform X2 [Megachile rotundata]|nr:PREDICTED: methylosome protein 50-like isoform X2 [Megachile rotundata]